MNPRQYIPFLAKMVENNYPLICAGEPGVGKTQITKQVAKKLDRKLFISHPVLDDPTDYKGLAWMSDAKNLIAKFIPLGIIAEMLDYTEDAIWFIDDFGQAPPAVQAALMQWLSRDERELNGKKLGENISIVVCTNGQEHNAGVSGFLEPVKSRAYTIINLEADVGSWTDWAMSNGISMPIISYLHMAPHQLSNFKGTQALENCPSPRTWTHLNAMLGIGLPDDMQAEVFRGTVGAGVAEEFMGFLRIYKDLPNIQRIKSDPSYSEKPTDTHTRYALVGALARTVDEGCAENVLNYMTRALPPEFVRMFHELMSRCHPEVMETEGYTDWAIEHQIEL